MYILEIYKYPSKKSLPKELHPPIEREFWPSLYKFVGIVV